MARKDVSMSNVFDSLQSNTHPKKDSDNEQKDLTQLKDNNHDNNLNDTTDDILDDFEDVSDDYNDFDNFKKDILNKYDKKRKRKTMEETHTRTTFLLENDLAHRLNKLTKNKRGLKTLVLNDAVRAIVIALENKK